MELGVSEAFGGWGGELQPVTGARMAEAKRQRMKVEPRRTLAAVLLVAYHRMARFGKVNANLVLAAGLELHLDERSAVGRGKPPPLGARELWSPCVA